MKTKILILFWAVSITFMSCDYLDVVPDNIATIDYAFRNRAMTLKYLYTCYSYLPQHGDVGNDVAMSGGDETWLHMFINWSTRSIANGQQNATSPRNNHWSIWQGIRDCNIFLENINNVPDIPQYEKTRWTGEVKFLKAYYHFYLFRMYGPIPIVNENLLVSAETETVKLYREPVDEVVDYIVDLLDEAYTQLPLVREVIQGTEAGRIDKVIAKCLKAKVLVYAASPLFNGNRDYVGLVDKRGVQLFPQQYDAEKWKRAADACKEAIDECHANGKSIYRLVDIITLTSPEVFQKQCTYRQAVTDRWNSELIWGGTNYDCSSLSRYCQAKIMQLAAEHTSIRSEWGPTMKMVEKYYSSNGVPIREDVDWYNNGWYDNRYKVRPEPSSGNEIYLVRENQRTVYLHYNREMRFYASIGFDMGIYYGNGYYDFPTDVRWTEFFTKAFSGMSSASECYSITGFSCKKMHSFKNALNRTTNSVEFYPFPILRLADLYLLYAEALNEYYGPTDEAISYIDQVRSRADLAGVKESWTNYSIYPDKPSTQDGLREIIRNERTIELAFEGQRFWDIRRWKQIQELNEQPAGWNAMTGENEEDFYVVTPVAQRPVAFTVRDYFWPFSESEVSINNNLVQNYGW